MDDDIVVGAACTTLICASFGAVIAIAGKQPKKDDIKRGLEDISVEDMNLEHTTVFCLK
jgi:hypothetical protein